MYDLVLVDQVVKSNPDKFERAFSFRTNIKIGVAVKKGNEELVSAVKEALVALQENGTQKALPPEERHGSRRSPCPSRSAASAPGATGRRQAPAWRRSATT
jgi:hypothetical protein